MTRPSLTGSSPTANTIGIVAVAALAASSLHGTRRDDHGHRAADQVSHSSRQAIVFALYPAVLDRHVLAFDIASVIEAFAERDRKARGGIGRPVSDKRDHRQRRPLPMRSKGPRNCSTAEERDELAPLHVPFARITLYAGLER